MTHPLLLHWIPNPYRTPQNMGTMSVLPVLGKHLNTYLPLLLVVHCCLIWANLWDRLVGACVGSKYRFSE